MTQRNAHHKGNKLEWFTYMKFVVPDSALDQSWKNASHEKHDSSQTRIHFSHSESSLHFPCLSLLYLLCVLVCCIHKRLANPQLYRTKRALLPRRFNLVR